MGKTKSNAQVRRLEQRAEKRGEVYVPPVETESPPKETNDAKVDDKETSTPTATTATAAAATTSNEDQSADRSKAAIAAKLKKELEGIETNEKLKAKDRRSAKRRVEAIASEKVGCPVEELLEWYKGYQKENPQAAKKTPSKKKEVKHVNPYIVFVGQLSYDTTKEGLFEYVKKELGKEHDVTPATVKVRLLTDPKSKKSRGMAFVEVNDPDTLYACLKLHQTFLDGRRLNIERSAGGGKNSETRQAKLKHYREEQDQYISGVVDTMLQDYKTRGEIRESELDEGVVLLCKRHSAKIVEAALENYVESNGKDMDNSSAYLSFLLTKFAEEGLFEKPDKEQERQERQERQAKRRPPSNDNNTGASRKKLRESSTFGKQGVDMKVSEQKEGDMRSIFPSFNRGRGR